MSVISYLNPKRVAAQEIAKDIIRHWSDKKGIQIRLLALQNKDKGLYNLVVEELGKYDYRVPSDS